MPWLYLIAQFVAFVITIFLYGLMVTFDVLVAVAEYFLFASHAAIEEYEGYDDVKTLSRYFAELDRQ